MRAGAELKGKRSRRQEIRTYATTTNALLELRDWLVAERVTWWCWSPPAITCDMRVHE